MKIRIIQRRILADTLSPVLCFSKIRKEFDQAALLESNDFGAHENSKSIIGFDPLLNVRVERGKFILKQGRDKRIVSIDSENNLPRLWDDLIKSIDCQGQKSAINGFFGHTSFESVQHFDSIRFEKGVNREAVPDMNYFFYRYLLIFDHYHDMLTIVENCPMGQLPGIADIIQLITTNEIEVSESVNIHNDERSGMTDQEFMDMVKLGKHHCHRGDVFQIVLSRQYSRSYEGDDFMIYRTLRTVNPSPYLYYFDFGDYRIFGSSPEQQLVIERNTAFVNPIAGTYKRTGNDEMDRRQAKNLSMDPKEQAEHMMLLDLARNDLGRHTSNVRVTKMKEIKYYSHVIHLVSQVQGTMGEISNSVRIFGDTFPAGTLSGAPKYKAMQLINKYEPHARGFYGGGIGYFNLDGDINHAIVIRSVLSKDNHLYYQAGAGVVEKSQEESELNEVENKLGAIRRALKLTNQLFKTSSYETIDR